MAGQKKEALISAKFRPYVRNLNEVTAAGDCLPFVGREREIQMVVETLIRQWKNNPVLVGKPGVGKTALVTEVASRIKQGQVPALLRGKTIIQLAVNAFVYSRESPEQLASDFEEFFLALKENQKLILFLDEIQFPSLTASEGRGSFPNLASLLKNHLASRDLTLIATATPEEYNHSVKHDEILSSCFEALFIPEPDRAEMRTILAGVKSHFEKYYSLKIPERLLPVICPLARRFHPTRAFPDRAIELLDFSCSKAAVKKRPELTLEEIYETLAAISRLPISILKKNPRRHYLGLQKHLEATLVDQQEALSEIARVLRIFNLERQTDAGRPLGILLFLGPAGIGKSRIAGEVAKYVYGSREKLRIINLSMFKKASDYDKLVSPARGHGPGLLIRELENHPFSIILFEHIGGVHEAVLDNLSRAITRSEIMDVFGKKHNLTNIIFILSLTSIGEVQRRESAIGFEKKNGQETEIVIDPKIMSVLDWMDEIIQFAPLTFPHLRQIAQQEADSLVAELASRFNLELQIDPKVLDGFARGAEGSGRFAHFVTEAMERQIRMRALDRLGGGRKKVCFKVTLEKNRIVFTEQKPEASA